MARFESSGPIDADIDIGVGRIEITASDRADVEADIAPGNPTRSGDVSLARDASVTFEGGRLRVRVPKRMNLFGPTDSVDVRIGLPTGSRLVIETAYGAVEIRGEVGASRIVAKYGGVMADTVGDLVLEAPYGDAEIAHVAGRLDAVAGHARLRVGRVDGDAVVKAAHGSIELGTVAGTIDIATSGPVEIDRALDDVTARSAHGSIRVREVTCGSIRIENGYAEVEVGVPYGVAAWVDAASSHGVVRNELTPDPSAADRDRTVELRLRANWADVVIRRASARAATGVRS